MSKFFCPLPWVHRFVQPSGIKICCTSNRQLNVSISEFNQSKYLADVKETIVSGQVPSECQKCVSDEGMGLTSTRTFALQEWPLHTDSVQYIDLRYNNLCNFACRTCEPEFSSTIAHEIKQHPELAKLYNAAGTQLDYSNLVKDLEPHYYTLKKLNLTGGEPLLIKENLQLLEKLIDIGRTDIQLLITTNVSTVNPKMLMLISQFDDVHWTLSIDAVGEAAEYVRYGSKWSVIEKNVHDILGLNHSVSINTTVSAYSILTLSKLLEWFDNLKSTYTNQPLEIMFHPVKWPEHLAPQVTPYRDRALLELERSIDILKTIKNNPGHELDNLNSLQTILKNSIINTSLSEKFFKFTHQLDKIRNQNFYQIYEKTI